MNRQDRFIAGFLVFQGVVGAGTLVYSALAGVPLPMLAWWTMPVLVAAALVAGVASFQRRRWGGQLGMVMFALQAPIFAVPGFTWWLWLGVHLDMSVQWAGEATLGVNLVGLVMYAWSSFRYYAPDSAFRPQPAHAAAEAVPH